MPPRILVVDDSPTIRTVVSMILERNGYDPKVASDGEDAYRVLASGEVKADLLLVDFVMPRMDGYALCRAIRANPELAAMPVVLMSAKGDRIREHFVEETGALDAITKPFDAQALVAVIENALRRVNTGWTSANRLPDGEVDGIVEPSPNPLPILEPETRRTHIAQIVGAKLASITAKSIVATPEALKIEGKLDERLLVAAIADRLTSEAIVEIIEAFRPAFDRKILLAGDLGVVPIGAVLQLLQSEIQTGVLVCTQGATVRPGDPTGAEIRATFRSGAIDLVQSTGVGDEFRLGRFFVEAGILAAGEIDAFLARTPTTGTTEISIVERPKPLGLALLEAGKITAQELRNALARQSSELLYEVIRWPSGRFELRRESPSELAEGTRLGLPVASVVMEGFRRVDEWRVLERTLGSFDTVLWRDDAAFGTFDLASLPAKEVQILDAVDGERTVRAIILASHQSSFDVCRILVQLLEARVLRRRTT